MNHVDSAGDLRKQQGCHGPACNPDTGPIVHRACRCWPSQGLSRSPRTSWVRECCKPHMLPHPRSTGTHYHIENETLLEGVRGLDMRLFTNILRGEGSHLSPHRQPTTFSFRSAYSSAFLWESPERPLPPATLSSFSQDCVPASFSAGVHCTLCTEQTKTKRIADL